jgi:hypothetical protein
VALEGECGRRKPSTRAQADRRFGAPFDAPKERQPRPSSAISSRQRRRDSASMARVSREYTPCFHRARRLRARPVAVRGPVLVPPCIRQRPFAMAGPRQAVCLRVLAPQRGAFEGSPGGLPFLSHPRRVAWGSSSVLAMLPPLARAPADSPSDDCLTARTHADVLD